MEFWVCVLVTKGKPTEPVAEALSRNASLIPGLLTDGRQVWCFEGAWRSVWPLSEDTIEDLGEIIVPCLGGLSDSKLRKVFDECGGKMLLDDFLKGKRW